MGQVSGDNTENTRVIGNTRLLEPRYRFDEYALFAVKTIYFSKAQQINLATLIRAADLTALRSAVGQKQSSTNSKKLGFPRGAISLNQGPFASRFPKYSDTSVSPKRPAYERVRKNGDISLLVKRNRV
jgi:hypothetical protein